MEKHCLNVKKITLTSVFLISVWEFDMQVKKISFK